MWPLLSALLSLVIAAFVIWIVGRFNLGLSVTGFGAAFIAAIAIGVVSWAVLWFLGLFGITVGGSGLWAFLVWLVVSAVVLLLAGKFVPGMTVKGFGGAMIAAIAISIVSGIVYWVLSIFNVAPPQ